MKRVYIGLGLTAFLALGISFFYVRSRSITAISEVSGVLENINSKPNSSLTENQLSQNRSKLDQVAFWLQNTPNLPQMPHQEAQQSLTKVYDAYRMIDDTFQNNQTAKTELQNAEDILAGTKEIDFSQPHDLAYWQSAKTQFSQAINVLESLPDNLSIDIQDKVNQALSQYSSTFSQIDNALTTEKNASDTLVKANTVRDRASTVIQGEQPDINELQDIQAQLQSAINLLANIPDNTTASQEAKSKLSEFQVTFSNLSNLIEEAERNACPYVYDDFQSLIGQVYASKYNSYGDVAQAESGLEQITQQYQDPKCDKLRPQVRNLLTSAWENHYNQEYNFNNYMASLQALNFCQPYDYGCSERSRTAERDKQEKLQSLNEERRMKIDTMRDRLSQ